MYMDFSKISILVVEDISVMRQLLADIIKTLGVGTVYTAADGKEGYDRYVLKNPDIIITDWHMPKMDGLQLIEKIRKDPKSPHRNVPIIMISGLNAPTRVAQARDLGVTEYLTKPFTVQDLAKRLSHIVSKPRDFILTPNFVGPDRRRRESDDFKGKIQRKKETDKKIKAEKYLQKKVGTIRQIDPWLITQSERVLEEIKINFIPIAQGFLKEFKEAIEAAEKSLPASKKIKEDIIFSVMQLKANAKIFKYGLIGELSSTTLNFLEGSTLIDDLILEILNAQHTTILHLINTRASGDGGEEGEALTAELTEAYKRYNKAKAQRQQKALLAKSLKETEE